MSAALQREGFDTSIIFLRDWVHNSLTMPTDEEIEIAMDVIAQKQPKLIGLGFMSSLYPIALEVTRRIQERFPHIPIIWGGIHPTSVPEECIPEVDYLCVGEGEMAAVELCKALRDGKDTTSIPNIWANVDGKIYENTPRPLTQDLDWLPYPDVRDDNKFYIEKNSFTIEEPWKRTAEYRIYFSRGCPYNCSYCYVSILRDVYNEKGKKFYRARSVDHIMGELRMAMKLFPKVARIKVDDDTSFAFGDAWMEEFLERYPKEVGIPFECMLIPPMLRPNRIRKLMAAGLVRVQTGMESASPEESVECHNRSPGNKCSMYYAEANKELGLNIVYDVIIDNPHATEKRKLETAEFLLELPTPYDIHFYSLNYFPGTAPRKKVWLREIWIQILLKGKQQRRGDSFASMDWPRSDEDRFYLAYTLWHRRVLLLPSSGICWTTKSIGSKMSIPFSTWHGLQIMARCSLWHFDTLEMVS